MGLPRSACHVVLVVDDEQVVLDALCPLLEATGFDVASACGADAAMALLTDGLAPDLILTDLSMPGRGGEDLASAVRAQARFRGTAIVAMSGCSRSLEDLRSKADARLLKPFELPALLQAFAHAWAARPLAR